MGYKKAGRKVAQLTITDGVKLLFRQIWGYRPDLAGKYADTLKFALGASLSDLKAKSNEVPVDFSNFIFDAEDVARAEGTVKRTSEKALRKTVRTAKQWEAPTVEKKVSYTAEIAASLGDAEVFTDAAEGTYDPEESDDNLPL